jgi:hypothetical protein
MIIYVVSSANISAAEDTETAPRDRSADVTISIEASVVRVGPDALEEIAGESDVGILNSIRADEILRRVRQGEGAAVISAVKLAVGNDSVAEMTAEETAKEKVKNAGDQTGEHAVRETIVSFQAEALVITADKIAVEFSFKQILSESSSSGSSDAEAEEGTTRTLGLSSGLVLHAGQPTVAGAQRNEDEATFLILRADM